MNIVVYTSYMWTEIATYFNSLGKSNHLSGKTRIQIQESKHYSFFLYYDTLILNTFILIQYL